MRGGSTWTIGSLHMVMMGRGVLIDHAFVGSKEKSKGTNEENEKRRGADEQII